MACLSREIKEEVVALDEVPPGVLVTDVGDIDLNMILYGIDIS